MITYSYISDKGDRDVNEDSVSIAKRRDGLCFTLCDGLGGHGSGDIASKTVTEVFSRIFTDLDMDAEDFFSLCYSVANEEVLRQQGINGTAQAMKTTVVSLVIKGDTCTWSHVRDSRLYHIGTDGGIARTRDHSVPQMLVMSKEIKEKDIRFHPDRNKLLRAVGSDEETPKYEVSETNKVLGFEAFLLCSDGFWELITEKQMCKLLKKSATPKEWLDAMKAVVLKNGKGKNMDNYSAIAVFISDKDGLF